MTKTHKIPKNTELAAESKIYKKGKKPTLSERKKWVMLKHKGKWQFAKRAALGNANGPHTVCYYDPDTGFYDDCHTV
jgi:hypothetical protein